MSRRSALLNAGIRESQLALSDNTRNDVTTTRHGLTPRLPNDVTKYLDGTGAYSIPPGTGITMDQADPYGIHHRLSGSSADDDEFSGGSIAGAWTQVGQGGSATWSQANHTLSCIFTNTGSAKVATILKAATLADGEAFETCVTPLGISAEFLMCGPIITDGVASNSKCFALLAYIDNAGISWKFSWWGGTVDALSGNSIATITPASAFHQIRLRIFRTSSTVFGIKASIMAGVVFDSFGTTTTNPGFTPTHAGLLVSKWTNSGNGIVAYDYFRHV